MLKRPLQGNYSQEWDFNTNSKTYFLPNKTSDEHFDGMIHSKVRSGAVGLGILSPSESPITLPHFRARFDAVDVGKCMNFYLNTLLRHWSLPRPCFAVFLKH